MPTPAVDTMIALLLLTWLIATALNQCGFRWFGRIRERDLFGLLPNWTFFSRDAGQWDYRLLYRDRHQDDNGGMVLTAWREIPVTERRRPHTALWNPEKRTRKFLTDVISLLQGSDPRDGNAVLLSMPYLIVLNVVCHQSPAPLTAQRQFVIVSALGRRPTPGPSILFRSAFHALR